MMRWAFPLALLLGGLLASAAPAAASVIIDQPTWQPCLGTGVCDVFGDGGTTLELSGFSKFIEIGSGLSNDEISAQTDP
jgi:hypothetical protein